MASRDHYEPRRNGTSPTQTASDMHIDNEEKLRYELAKTVTLTPELYEKLFISPKTQVAGSLRTTFGNPTPVGVLGFSVSVLPLACAFMGWRGSGGLAVATTGATIWFGGILLFLAGIGEFLLGNNFPMIVFLAYGAHLMTFATTFIPWFNAIGFFNPNGSGIGSPGTANQTSVFLSSFAFYLIAMGILSFLFLLGSLRVNGVFVLIFLVVTIGFGLGAGAFFHLGKGNVALGNKLATGTGACFFAASVLGFYFLLALIIAIMELPIPDPPVFDLSTVIKPKSRAILKEE
ncbi:GPR1/FUN34/YaaH-class plasma membrane protein [Setomelanomma holmii]|uniref:GPR1/FUN34/YaaH-class plasma membrane protein n=1 Tax=Setomelanomma holmii TaxID=210430 RepID=A0A9P4GYV5_9PLEO|nr:GPR1/FUN34/YaaH-class plasma membrane protein [Setomelanomma holmii]